MKSLCFYAVFREGRNFFAGFGYRKLPQSKLHIDSNTLAKRNRKLSEFWQCIGLDVYSQGCFDSVNRVHPTLFESEKHTHQNRLRFRSTVTAVVKLSNIIYNESTRAAKRATAMLFWASFSPNYAA